MYFLAVDLKVWNTMTKYVVYHEPFHCEHTGKVFNKEIRVSVEDAIEWQKGHAYVLKGYIYDHDDHALQDFLIINWGTVIDV